MQDLSAKFIVEFLKNIKDQKIPIVVKNQRDLGLDFHLLDLETIKEISENYYSIRGSQYAIKISTKRFKETMSIEVKITIP